MINHSEEMRYFNEITWYDNGKGLKIGTLNQLRKASYAIISSFTHTQKKLAVVFPRL